MQNDLQKRKSAVPSTSGERSPSKVPKSTESQNLSHARNHSQIYDVSTERLIDKWLIASQGNALISREVQGKKELIEAEQKCKEAEEKIQLLTKELSVAKGRTTSLSAAFKSEEEIKNELANKLNATWEMIPSITEHANSLTETLKNCEQQIDQLSNVYDNVIAKNMEVIKHLRKKINDADIRTKVERMRAESLIRVKETDIIELKAKFGNFEEEITRGKEIASNALNELRTVEKRLLEVNTEKRMLEEAVKNLKDSWKLEKESLIADSMEKQKDITATKQDYDKLWSSFKILEEESRKLAQREEQLKQELCSKEEEYQKTLCNLQSVEEKWKEYEKRFKEFLETIKELERKEMDSANVTEKLNEEIHDLKTQLATLQEEKMRCQSESHVKIQETIKSYKNLHESLERDLIIQKEKYEVCSKEKQKIQSLHSAELSKLLSALSESKCEYEKLNEKYYSIKKNNEDLQNKIEKMTEIQAKEKFESQAELTVRIQEYMEKEIAYRNKIKELENKCENIKISTNVEPTTRIEKPSQTPVFKGNVIQSSKQVRFDVESSSDTSTVDIESVFPSSETRFENLLKSTESPTKQAPKNTPMRKFFKRNTKSSPTSKR